MLGKQKSLSQFALKIIKAISSSEDTTISPRIVPVLEELLTSRSQSDRKIASFCILFLSQKCQRLYTEFKENDLVKTTENLVVLGLDTQNTVKDIMSLESTLSFLDQISCSSSDKFYMKYGNIESKKSKILSITELKYYLEQVDFDEFPDPKEHTMWTFAVFENKKKKNIFTENKMGKSFTIKQKKKLLPFWKKKNKNILKNKKDFSNSFRVKKNKFLSMKSESQPRFESSSVTFSSFSNLQKVENLERSEGTHKFFKRVKVKPFKQKMQKRRITHKRRRRNGSQFPILKTYQRFLTQR